MSVANALLIRPRYKRGRDGANETSAWIRSNSAHGGNFEKMPQGNNTKKNQEATSLYKQYKLNKKQQRDIHDLITGQKLTRKQIEDVIKEYLKK